MTRTDSAELAALIAEQDADMGCADEYSAPSVTEYEWFRARNYISIGDGRYVKESCVGAE